MGAYHSQRYPKAAYAASITHLDHCGGKLLSYLRDQGLCENTLVIFSSDNGPANEGGADPAYFESSGKLRGKKRELYEGGIRVPMIAIWPAVIKAKCISAHVSGFQDVLPTLAEVSGGKLQAAVTSEGISFYATLVGNPANQRRHDYL